MKVITVIKTAVFLFFLGFTTIYVSASNIPPASELIDKYTLALDSTSSAIEDYEKKTEAMAQGPRGLTKGSYFTRGQYRYDSDRFYEREYLWGDYISGVQELPENKPHYRCCVVNDKVSYQNSKNINNNTPGSVIRQKKQNGRETDLGRIFGVSYLAGYIGSDLRLDEIIREAGNVSVRSKTERIGDSECFVVEADTIYGKYVIWLDGQHGFHPAQVLHKGSKGDNAYTNILPEGGSAKTYLKNVRFEQVDGVWVPMEADAGSELIVKEGFSKENYHFKRNKIILNPDHDKVGSFEDPLENPENDPELKNGTRVQIDQIPIRYTWQDGKLVPNVDDLVVGQIDKMMSDDQADDGKNAGILLKFSQMQKNVSSLYFRGVKTVKGAQTQTVQSQYATDGSQISFRVMSKDHGINAFVWDGKKTINYLKSSGRQKITASDDKKKIYSLLSEHYPGAGLLGYFNGQDERIDTLLSKALKKASYSKVNLNGEKCNLIESQIGQHKYRVWFSPANGYNIIKAEVKQNSKIVYLLDQVQFKKFEDVWVPVSCAVMDSSGVYTYKRTKIDLKPDLVKLKAFALPVSNGTPVSIEKQHGDFIWRNDNIVDKEGKIVF